MPAKSPFWLIACLSAVLLIGISLIVLFGYSQKQVINSQASWHNFTATPRPTVPLVNSKQLSKCLDLAYKSFQTKWTESCTIYGLNHRNPNCNLPEGLAGSLNQRWEVAKVECTR